MSSKPLVSTLRDPKTAQKSAARLQTPSSPESTTEPNAVVVTIKKEVPDDEIKEYAATAMSELLGWYGYEKVDSGCTRGLNLDHFGSSVASRHHRRQREVAPSNVKDGAASSKSPEQTKRSSRSPVLSRPSGSSPASMSVGSCKDNGSVGGHRPSSPASSLQTGPASPRALDNSDSASDTPDSATTCTWCGRVGGSWEPGNAPLSFTVSNNSGRFCSEACFAAGRRAAFKRARTCDWCKHVRHSVSYVDFQDGESQLQFCSDKCLNQYKMNIFCRETQAHLALHGLSATIPGSSNTSMAAGLITPELWLRDCRSPPQSPMEENLIVDDEPTSGPSNCLPEGDSAKFKKSASIRAIVRTFEDTQDKTDDTDGDTILDCENVKEAIRESLRDEERRIKCREAAREAARAVNKNYQVDVEATVSIGERFDGLGSSRDCVEADVLGYNSSASPPNDQTPEVIESRCEGTLHVKDVKKLLANNNLNRGRHYPRHSRPRRVSRSPPWLAETLRPPPQLFCRERAPYGGAHFTQPTFSYSPPPSRLGPHAARPKMPMGPPPHSVHPKNLSSHQAASSLLPPVTVLVPYPIPVPIPIPIPIPIPLLGKFFADNNRDSRTKSPSNSRLQKDACSLQTGGPLPEDLSQRGKTTITSQTPRNQSRRTELSPSPQMTTGPSRSSSRGSPIACSSSTSGSTNAEDNSSALPTNARSHSRSLRKRRRAVENSDDPQIHIDKRRSKFVPV